MRTMFGRKSSFKILPTPWLSAKVQLIGAVRLTANDSFNSFNVSPRTATMTALFVWPGSRTTTPFVPTKSAGDEAVRLAVA